MTVSWTNFCCPRCLRVTSKPWRGAWCACDPAYSLQGYDPSDESERKWTEMRILRCADLRVLVGQIRSPQWCPVCKTYHDEVGEKTDAGELTRQCPRIPVDHPRNVFANFPGRVR